jgi:RHS repeat-associated protein
MIRWVRWLLSISLALGWLTPATVWASYSYKPLGPAIRQSDPACAGMKLDADTDVDQTDFGLFQRCWSGTEPAAPGCTGAGGPGGGLPASGSFVLHGRPVDVLPDGHALLFVRARFYDLQHGRWLQRDPKGYVDGGNLYEAFGGNAVRNVDPNGEALPAIIAGAAIVYFLWPPDPAVAPQGTPGEQEYIQALRQQIERERIFFVSTVFLFPLAGAAGDVVGAPVRSVVGRATGSELAGATTGLVSRSVAAGGLLTVGQEAALAGAEYLRGGSGTVSMLYDDPTDVNRIGVGFGLNTLFFGGFTILAGQAVPPRTALVEVEGQAFLAVEAQVPLRAGVATEAGVRPALSTTLEPATMGRQYVFEWALPSSEAAASGAGTVPTAPRVYSVAFETRLNPSSYPGVLRSVHFQEANEVLLQAMEADAQFAQMMQQAGVNLRRTVTGLVPRTSPAGWSWHHAQESGVMQLVPRSQHAPGSIFQDILHPSGQGGYSIWGQ